MAPTDGGFYQGQAKRPSSSNGKEGKLMENPEMIGSYGSAGFVLKAFPPPHNETDFITAGSRVSM
jgi:hypothetical protein